MPFRKCLIGLVVCLAGCYPPSYYRTKIIKPVLQEQVITKEQEELDNIFSLLTYALVYKDWQPDTVDRAHRRGYNIGALLVNPQQQPVFYGLNCINSTDNATQHGEVRAITTYIDRQKCFNLEGYTIYTTLEPCIMCAGMITMTAVKRAVYGQHDVAYSRAFERLAADTRTIGGFAPYPRPVTAQASKLIYCQQLDSAYQSFLQTDPEKILAKFLTSEAARSIFKHAHDALLNFKVQFPAHEAIYRQSIQFLNTPPT